MMRQVIYLPDWRWRCEIFYDAGVEDAEYILWRLRSIGCKGEIYQQACRNLRSGKLDTGLTFSNYNEGESVLFISRTSSAEEFSDTYDHEKNHLAKHICQAQGIDPFGEEASYISGAINKRMFAAARQYLCECCRAKLHLKR